MAISFDSAGHFDAGFGGSYSTTINTITQGAYLFVLSEVASNPTYGGQSIPRLLTYSSPINDGNGVTINVYGLANAPGGSNTLSVINTGATYNVVWSSYTGVSSGTQPEASIQNYSNNGTNNTQVATFSASVNTITDKAWTILFSGGGNNNNPMTAGIGTLRASAAGTILASTVSIIDSNGPISPPGSSTLQAQFTNGSGGQGSGFISVSIFSVMPTPDFTPQMTII